MERKILIGVLIVLFFGCEKESHPCEITKAGENYVLSDSAKALVSNYNTANKIIFKTIAGDEVAFDVIEKDTLTSYLVGWPCESATMRSQTITGTTAFLSYSIVNNALFSKPLVVSLFGLPDIPMQPAQESLVVSLGRFFSNSFNEGDLLFDYKIGIANPEVNYLDSFLVAGRTFYEVYEMNYSSYTPQLEIKYSLNEGIVYMRDSQTSLEYIYERKE